jgi:ABC-2 type transport system ATP-binding protein
VSPPALACHALAKRYGAKAALAGVDLDVEPGELVGLLGPNGAGKSTLTKIACGLVRPSGGTAQVCGATAGSSPARAALGYLAELFRFPGWSSADEVLVLHQRLAGSAGGPGERAELLELVGLDDARDVRVAAMSKGMQQRLGIAQALVGTPRLLLLDEPTSALDLHRQVEVLALIEELAQRRGICVVLAIHDLNQVLRVADRVMVIDEGTMVRCGPVETVITPDLLRAIYKVDGRIELCSRRCRQVIIDGPLGGSSESAAAKAG